MPSRVAHKPRKRIRADTFSTIRRNPSYPEASTMPQPNLSDLVTQAKQRHLSEVGIFGKPIDSMTAAERAAALESVRPSGGLIGDLLAGQARSISELLDLAESAPPVSIRYAGGNDENPRVTPAPPPMAVISLARELIPSAQAAEQSGVHYDGLPHGKPGEVVPLSAEIMRNSSFCRAGGHLVINDPVPLQLKEQAGREARDVFVERERQFRVVTPLQFGLLNAGELAVFPPSPWPAVGDDAIDGLNAAASSTSLMQTFGARVQLTRRQQASLPRKLWAQELSIALAAGIARLADKVAFGRLDNYLAATAWAWSWPATKGIAHNELKAVIGTNGTGAQVSQDGRLTYAGVCEAELSPVMSGTLVGDWTRSCIFVANDATLVVKRDSVSGTLDMTAVVQLRFEAPRVEDFFTKVSA